MTAGSNFRPDGAAVTVFENHGNAVLTKTLSLDTDGNLTKTPAAAMSRGTATVHTVASGSDLKALLAQMQPHEALALGVPNNGNQVSMIVANRALGKRTEAIARSLRHFGFRKHHDGWMLIDADLGRCPQLLAQRIEQEGIVAVLADIVPEIAAAESVVRPSTSAKLTNAESGEAIIGSRGVHMYIRVKDAADIPRATKSLFDKLLLAELGWIEISKAGSRLLRAPVDATVGSPERLVFEGAPVLHHPVAQQPGDRAAIHHPGNALDTHNALPSVAGQDAGRVRAIIKDLKEAVRDEAAAVASEFDATMARKIAEDYDVSEATARNRVSAMRGGELTHPVELHMDDGDVVPLGDVLAAPATYHLATCADPFEGPGYGRCKVKIYWDEDTVSLALHSLAHGVSTLFHIKHSAYTIGAILDKIQADNDAGEKLNISTEVRRVVDAVLNARLDPLEEDEIKDRLRKVTGTKARALNQTIKKRASLRQKFMFERRRQATPSSIPRVLAPSVDAPLREVVRSTDAQLAQCPNQSPPAHTVAGIAATVRARPPAGLHLLTGADEEDAAPPPSEPLITELAVDELHMTIEDYVTFFAEVKVNGVVVGERDVRLPAGHIHALHHYQESNMPIIRAVVTAPFVAATGQLVTGAGLQRQSGLYFDIPQDVAAALPNSERPTLQEAQSGLSFLMKEWLCDVESDWRGKVALVALSLTIIERAALPERPAWLVRANQRGGGKTTVLNMIATAVLGRPASAVRWSDNEEERRKALLPMLSDGAAFAVWDNLPRGYTIDCAALNSVLTASEYTDRILGKSQKLTVPATSIFALNGNNVAPGGDFCSRCLCVDIENQRPDPENRPFEHQDPIGWTRANRKRILHSLYAILLWNPRRHPATEGTEHPEAKTRFKTWWHLVGFPLEELARQRAIDKGKDPTKNALSFAKSFAENEQDNPEALGLVKVLTALHDTIGANGALFTAKDISAALNMARGGIVLTNDTGTTAQLARCRDDFESGIAESTGKALPLFGDLSGHIVGKKLQTIESQPVDCGGGVLRLRRVHADPKKGNAYQIEVLG